METIQQSGPRVPWLTVEFDQERNNGAADAGELVTPASIYWFNQAVGAENPASDSWPARASTAPRAVADVALSSRLLNPAAQ